MTTRQVHFAMPEITDDDVDAVVNVLRSGWLTTGSVSHEFEKALADYLGVAHVMVTSSGTTALECAFAGLGLPLGAHVAVPAWTFVSTVSVLARLRLRPMLVDSDPHSLNMSVTSLQHAVARGAKAVLPVHFAGTPVDSEIFDLAAQRRLPVIEDCAHALGAVLDKTRVSRAACYSFYATKNLTTGEGGAVATDDGELADFVRVHRLHGMSKDAWRRHEPGGTATYDVVSRGIKANLPDLLAALGMSQLRRIHSMQARRRHLVLDYRERLADVPGITCIPETLVAGEADHLFVVLLPAGSDRDTVAAAMASRGVTTSVHFQPVHRFSAIRPLVDVEGGLPVCEAMWPRVLSLPLYPTLASDDVDRVVETLAGVLRTTPRRHDVSHDSP
jgi:dTDP-4-amino-4,6-dideoxygalactose transaminase